MQFRAHARRVVQVGGGATLALASVLSTTASRADAQGFGLNEIGSCAIGRGFAVTGAPCEDASVLYWNPGAATSIPRGFSLYGGISAIQVKGSFTRDGTGRRDEGDVPIELPPFLGVTWKGSGPTSSRLALGLAAYVPYGLTSQWQDDFPGRFAAQKASLQTIYVQPTIAYEIVPGRFSVGAGPVIGHSSIEIRQAIDFSTQPVPGQPAGTTFGRLGFAPGTEFANAEIQGGSKLAIGGHVGAQLKVTPTLSVGARYLTSVKFEYDDAEATFTPSARASQYVLQANNALGLPAGTTLAQITAPQFQSGGTLAPGQTASTEIEHPAQFQVGIGFTGIPRTTLSADYGRTFWSSFDELPVTFPAAGATPSPLSRVLIEEYEDISSYRVGLEHRFGGAAGGMTGGMLDGVAARLGFSYAESPAPEQTVTPLLPDMNRYNFSGGLGIPLGERFTLDAAYLRVETEGRRGRTDERPESLSPQDAVRTLNNGWYSLNANIFSVSLKARF